MATDAEGSVELRVDWGDGTAPTPWQAANGLNHTYTTPGHYLIQVQARDDGDPRLTATSTIRQTVFVPPALSPSISSASLAYDAGRKVVWAVAPDNDVVSSIDALTRQRKRVIALPDGSDPRSIAVDPSNGAVWVACHDSDQVLVLGEDGSVLSTISLPHGSAPTALLLDALRSRVFVSCTGSGEILLVDLATRNISASLLLGPTPGALALTGDGTNLLVCRFISGNETGTVWRLRSADLALQATISLWPSELEDTGATGRGLPNYLSAIAIHPDGQTAWVTAKQDNIMRGGFRSSEDLKSDQTVRSIVCILDLSRNQERYDQRLDIDNSDAPYGVAFHPRGDYAFVSLQGLNSVHAFDLLPLDGSVAATLFRMEVGSAPQSLLVTEQGLWSHDFLSRQVTWRDLTDMVDKGLLPGSTATTRLIENEKLGADVLAGKKIFYHAGDVRMSSEGYISCASCHRDGGHDGRVWDFTARGEGLRNTITLHGRAGMGQGFVHWSANFDEIQDFENDIRKGFGGKGFLTDAQFAATADTLGSPKAGLSKELDQLAAYVSSLTAQTLPKSPERSPGGALTTAAERGRDLLVSQNCLSCHRPEQGFTDGQRHDVGTIRGSSGKRLNLQPLDGVDTPTLLGLHATAPYLHDGSAESLDEVFRVVGGMHIAAEDAQETSAARIQDNSHTFWVGGGYLEFLSGQEARWQAALDSVQAGPVQLTLRYAADVPVTVVLSLAGMSREVRLGATKRRSLQERTVWGTTRIDWTDIPAGRHDLVLRSQGSVAIDDLDLAGPDRFVAAFPHRRVLALSPAQQQDLTAFIASLDSHNVPELPTTIAYVDFDFSAAFNADVIINGNPFDTIQDGFDGDGRSYFTANAVSVINGVDDGLPNNALFPAVPGVHPAVQLGWRDADNGKNAIRLTDSTPVTIVLDQQRYEELHLYFAAGGGDGTVSIDCLYLDGSKTSFAQVVVDDWFNDGGEVTAGTYTLINNLDRSHRGDGSIVDDVSDAAIFGRAFTLDGTRSLKSITISRTNGGSVVIFGAVGKRLVTHQQGRFLSVRLSDRSGLVQAEVQGYQADTFFSSPSVDSAHRVGPLDVSQNVHLRLHGSNEDG